MKPLSSLLLWPFLTLWDMVTEHREECSCLFFKQTQNTAGPIYSYVPDPGCRRCSV